MSLQTPIREARDRRNIYSRKALQVGSAPLLQGMDNAGERISFVFGFPDAASLPAAQVAEKAVHTLATQGRTALQYGDNTGYSGLIDALLTKLARDQGIRANRENVLITAGGSQGVDLLLDTFVDWGDTIASEMPLWLGAVKAFRNAGVNVLSIPIDNEGIDVRTLERELSALQAKGVTPKFVYAISNFQNPTGVTMSLQRRHDLLDVVKRFATILIEDDAYFDLRYDGEPIPSIYSLDDSGSVIYLGTLSKTMGPGMRLGWLVGPPEIIRRIAALKVDGGTNIFGAHVAAQWLPDHLEHHVAHLREIYHRRRDIMLDALQAHMPEGTTWSVPDGGFFIWVTLPEGLDTTRMHDQVQELGVEYLPGPASYADGSGANQIRLSFSFVEDDRIERGVRIIGDVAKADLREGRQ